MKSRGALWAALGAGVLGFALLGLGVMLEPRRAAAAYLAAFGFAVSVALGSLILLLIGHASGATWFVALRRLVEALALALVPLAALFVPIVLGARWLYPWAAPDAALARELGSRRGYLNVPFFAVRGAVYFAIVLAVTLVLRRWSVEGEPAARAGNSASGETDARRAVATSATQPARARALSAAALPPVGFAATFAAFDWFMSLEPKWYSNLYGLYFFASGFLGAVALTAIGAYVARRAQWLPPAVGESHFHAVGRVLLAATALWAYLAFAQFLLVWIADLPEEVVWYRSRLFGGWRPVAVLLATGRFALPFFVLLQRSVTRHPARLAVIAAWVLATTYLDVYWLVLPAFDPQGPRVHWVDFAALAAVVGTVGAFGASRLRAAAPLPEADPRFSAALEYQSS